MTRKRKRGRPTRLDAKLIRQICDLLSEGISITAACDALAVDESTYYRWVRENAEFRQETTRARANGKIALVRRILASKDWKALSWYLAVCWPAEFAKERTAPTEPPVELPMTPEEEKRILESFRCDNTHNES